jgi:Arc/MetJ-type ribon-helix-helix transcriptional regulator
VARVPNGGVQGLGHDAAAKEGWFTGPPYAVQEHVFDEEAISDCVREYEPITVVFPTLQKPVTLSPEQTAKVWRAVSAGQYASPEEYVNTAIETLLKRLGERDKASKAEDLMDRYVNTLNELG